MDIRDYFTIIRRSWRLLAVTTIIGALLAVAAHVVITPRYQATGEVLVSTPEGGNPTEMLQSATVARDFVQTLAALVRTEEIADRVSKRPNINRTTGEIAAILTATPVEKTPLLQISAIDTDPAQAQRLATATVAVLIALAEEVSLPNPDGTVAIRLSTLGVPTLPSAPVGPSLFLKVITGTFAGFIIGFLIVVIRRLSDDRVRDTSS